MTVLPVHSSPHTMRARRTRPATDLPDPQADLAPLGEKCRRTATALAELAVETSNTPELWGLQGAVVEAVIHEFVTSNQDSFNKGILQGKWLVEKQSLKHAEMMSQMSALQSRLNDIQIRYDVLHSQYTEARETIHRSTMRDISNTLAD